MRPLKRPLTILMLLFLISIGAGCSGQQTTTVTKETTAAAPDAAAPDAGAQSAPPQPATTTTTTTTTSSEPDSLLGATFHAVGTIILLPFRLIGDALELIL
jgi:hypothetical protein